jgi:hypothetical protein
VLTTFGLCAGIPPRIWLYFLCFEALGAAFYFFYGRHHSLVNLAF